ncbi:Protein of unknown function [Solimonas aquatica]|uniref:DUF721 domain-containing protein n=1 Tax=Solimonas aquatica TaxID=489703 RepID=A0A1H9K2Z5_9GAMM|nr:DciA family protein [Solimonas aquatica]SEQ93293.1 Protein of unknown function [Solimonas aquatica]
MRDPQPLSQVLNLAAHDGGGWLARLRQLQAINQSLPQWCAEPWVKQLRVANLREGVVVVYSASATALVPLRHRSNAFLRWLKDYHGLDCQRLALSVRPR